MGNDVSLEWIRTLRTSLQIVAGLSVVAPFLIAAIGISTTAGVGAAVLAVAATVTRIMQIPEIDQWVNQKLGKTEQ